MSNKKNMRISRRILLNSALCACASSHNMSPLPGMSHLQNYVLLSLCKLALISRDRWLAWMAPLQKKISFTPHSGHATSSCCTCWCRPRYPRCWALHRSRRAAVKTRCQFCPCVRPKEKSKSENRKRAWAHRTGRKRKMKGGLDLALSSCKCKPPILIHPKN